MIIQQPNPDTSILPKTYLSTSVSLGTVLPVKNINSFSGSQAIQIGETGETQTEIAVISGTPSGTALYTTGTITYTHPLDTPVYPINFNQIVFKRSTTGTAGTAVAITSGTVALQPNHPFTQFEDASGAATHAYKTAYYNSVLTTVSDDSDWILPAGGSQFSLAQLRKRIRDKLFNSAYVTDETLNDWINEWKDEMTNTAIKVNKDYAIGATTLTFAADQEYGTITESDYKSVRRIWFVDASGTFTGQQMGITDFKENENFSDNHPMFYYYGDNILGRRPKATAVTMNIVYYKLNTNLVNDNDELPTSMRGYTKSFLDYCMAQAYMKDNNQEAAMPFMTMAQNGKLQFEKEITPRHESGAEYAKSVEPTCEDEGYYYF